MYIITNSITEIHLWGNAALLCLNNSNYIKLDEIETAFALMINECPEFERACHLFNEKYQIGDLALTCQKYKTFIDNYRQYYSVVEELPATYMYNTKVTGKRGYYYPLSLVIYLRNYCGLRCVHCFRGEHQKNIDIESEKLFLFLDEITKGTNRIQLSGGEPLLGKELINILNRYPMCHFSISTSAYVKDNIIRELIKHNNVEYIQVSLYSSFLEKHDRFVGVQSAYAVTAKNIETLVNAGKNVIVSTVITTDFLDEIEEFIKFCISIGVRAVKFGRIMPVGRAKECKDILIDEQQFETAKSVIAEMSLKYEKDIFIFHDECANYRKKPGKIFDCQAGTLNWSVSEKGEIFPCSFYMNKKLCMGRISRREDYMKLVAVQDSVTQLQKVWYEKRKEISNELAGNERTILCPNLHLE